MKNKKMRHTKNLTIILLFLYYCILYHYYVNNHSRINLDYFRSHRRPLLDLGFFRIKIFLCEWLRSRYECTMEIFVFVAIVCILVQSQNKGKAIY